LSSFIFYKCVHIATLPVSNLETYATK